MRHKKNRTISIPQGPRIVAIGGGHGLSTMLRGLKHHTQNLTAVVTVADDGGGSGVLRQEMGMPPPGDIRNWQAFGNLLLAALNGVSDSFDQAVTRMSQVMAITGRILPVTNSDVQLEAVFENGTHVLGESKIFAFKKEQDCRIDYVRLLPAHPPALPETLEAIDQAEMILLGPGSLYTSVIPNLLVDGVADAICRSKALKVYVCNIMTQEGETEGYSAADHVTALLGVVLVERDLTSEDTSFARHSPEKLARAIMELYHDRAHTKIF